jgi:esterase/lipase
MVLLAAADGIVPRDTAEFPYHQVSSRERKLVVVGDDKVHVAHADLFISNRAHADVYTPLSDWLRVQNA